MFSVFKKYIALVLLVLVGVLNTPTELLHGVFDVHQHETIDKHFDCHAHHIEQKHNHCPALDFTSPEYTSAKRVAIPKCSERFHAQLFLYVDKGFSSSITTCFLRGPPIV